MAKKQRKYDIIIIISEVIRKFFFNGNNTCFYAFALESVSLDDWIF